MNPLKISKQEFIALINKPVAVTTKIGVLNGRIKDIRLASDPPHEVGAFILEISPETEIKMAGKLDSITLDLSVIEATDIEVLS